MLRVVCCCFYFSFQFHTFHYVATQLIQLHHVVVIAALAFSSLFHSIIVIILVHNSLLYFSPSSSFFLSSFFFISFFHPSNFQTISPNFLLISNRFHFIPHSFNLLHFLLFLNLLTLFLLPISFTFPISNVHHQPFSFPATTNVPASSFSSFF